VAHSDLLVRRDHRPVLARAMCVRCGRRWLEGRRIWHTECASRLAHAFDLHFERVREP